MRRRPIVLALSLTAALVLVLPDAGFGANYFGKLDLVDHRESMDRRPRFLVRSESLSLFASEGATSLLLECFFRQLNVSLSYNPMRCPGSITGSCGEVVFVSVDRDRLVLPPGMPELRRKP